MSAQTVVLKEHSNSYNIFILVLTIMSLAVMVLLILPLDPQTLDTLRFYDNAICVVFLVDFFGNVTAAHPKNAYLMGRRGWLDLFGSIPSFALFPAAGLLRLFRLSRLARISRMLRGNAREALVKDVLDNRGQYATFITVLSAFMVLSISTVLMVQFESEAPGANITTVGYGDTFPVTTLGRITAVAVMFAGVGIIGSLASILASILVPPPKAQEADGPTPAADPSPTPGTADPSADAAIALELASIRAELTALRQSISPGAQAPSDPRATS